MIPAYQVQSSTEHLGDMTYDVAPLGARERFAQVFLMESEPIAIEEPIEFVANFATLAGTDLPVCDERTWPVMSRHMLDTLLSVGAFSHRAIACRMIDDTVMPPDRYDDRGLRSAIVDDRFVLVHLTTHVDDAFDWKRSVFERDNDESERLLIVTKLVLRDVPLPPLFRLAPYPRKLFVSSEAKEAIDRTRLGGVELVRFDFGM